MPSFEVTELRSRHQPKTNEPTWSCYLATVVSNRTKWGSREGGASAWDHDFEVVVKRSFGRRLLPHLTVGPEYQVETALISSRFEVAFENSRKVGRHAHGLLRLEHRSGKTLMVDYQGVRKMINDQLGHPCRVHFQLIRCKPEWSFDSVRTYITKQQLASQETTTNE
jgi:hypothetical protein